MTEAKIGIVIMHGKGGSPTKNVSTLAYLLAEKGYLVKNLEMPWSGMRSYDVDVKTADSEVESALNALKEQGAMTLFVAGHSQGGVFALHFGATHTVDGVIAIAPGGNVGGQGFRGRLGETVALARQLINEGKGGEQANLVDFEGSKGTYPIPTTPSVYMTWFDPDGAMNESMAIRSLKPSMPVLFIVPTNDHPGLLKVKQEMFDALPKNVHTKLYEPKTDHLGAPTEAVEEIVVWTTAIAHTQ